MKLPWSKLCSRSESIELCEDAVQLVLREFSNGERWQIDDSLGACWLREDNRCIPDDPGARWVEASGDGDDPCAA